MSLKSETPAQMVAWDLAEFSIIKLWQGASVLYFMVCLSVCSKSIQKVSEISYLYTIDTHCLKRCLMYPLLHKSASQECEMEDEVMILRTKV